MTQLYDLTYLGGIVFLLQVLRHCVETARQREEIKECLTTVKQVFLLCQEGSLVDHRAYKP